MRSTDPVVTVVVPARGEETVLPTTLPLLVESCRRLPEPVEILVVVPHWSTVWQNPPSTAPELRWVRAGHAGKFEALRSGVAAASGTALLFFDADVLVDDATVYELARPLLDDDTVDVVAGRIQIARRGRSTIGRCLENWATVSSLAWHAMRAERPALLWALPGAVWGVRRDLFPDELLVPSVDDVSIGLALRDSGARFRYVPDAAVRTWAPHSVLAWSRQKLRARTGWAALGTRRPDDIGELESTFRHYLERIRPPGPSAVAMEVQDRLVRGIARTRARGAVADTGVWETTRLVAHAPTDRSTA